jgi:hypothetical protein
VIVMVRLSMRRMRWERARVSSANRARATLLLLTWSGVVWEKVEDGGVRIK